MGEMVSVGEVWCVCGGAGGRWWWRGRRWTGGGGGSSQTSPPLHPTNLPPPYPPCCPSHQRHRSGLPLSRRFFSSAALLADPYVADGQSAYNSNKRFTGWADPDLTNRGRDEARLAGQLLKATGIDRIDVLYTSLLKRAVKTAWLALDEMDLQWTPILNTWRLNERNYGALQGHVKAEVAKVHGLKQVQKWRRGYADRPPPWDRLQREKTVDRRYASAAAASGRPALSPGQRGEFPPLSESLADCHGRLVPFLEEELWPAMEKAMEHARGVAQAGYEYQVPTMVVVASENVLRAMVMHMEGLEQDEVPLIDVPYATPLVYQLDSALAPIDTPWAEFPLNAGWYLGDPAKVRAVQAEIQADLPPAAEDEEVCLVRPDVEEPPSWKCG